MAGFRDFAMIFSILLIVKNATCRMEQKGRSISALLMNTISLWYIYITQTFIHIYFITFISGSTIGNRNDTDERDAKLCKNFSSSTQKYLHSRITIPFITWTMYYIYNIIFLCYNDISLILFLCFQSMCSA